MPWFHIRSAGAAGKISIAFWDHWVPQGNVVMRQQVDEWAKKNMVQVTSDFITSNGNKLLLTAAAEKQARAGHDAIHVSQWDVHNYRDALEPVDDVVQGLTAKYGAASSMCEYLAKIKGHWLAIPSSCGAQTKPPCARISILKQTAGIDVTEMYPTHPGYTPGMQEWTWELHLKAAEAAAKIGKNFAIGLGQTSDSVDTAGSLFAAYGGELVDAQGNIKADSPEVHQVLEHAQKLVKFLPKEAVSFDDASNNRALISGQSALIWNPPSAWAVAKRDAPAVAADCWTFSAPSGPKGRFVPIN
ncbi:MAG: ABC transporter substrate-binding protein, partial [Acetobacteraceae bacterium]